MTADDAYYWSSGRRIRLRPRDEFAIDLARARKAKAIAPQVDQFRDMGTELTPTLRLIEGRDVPNDVREMLDSIGAVQPVYQTDDKSLIVVLPEVRVETSDPKKEQRLYALVKQSEAIVADVKNGRFLIRPSSGRGADALELANRVVEQLKPEVAQARFMRVVPRHGRSRT